MRRASARPQNTQLVQQLRRAGAVLLAKTNVPQTMLSFECANPLFGRSASPWSRAHTCGGSSGGEGALLAGAGAALGLGSDIGGSLRIPAAYCGIYSLKPGQLRFSKYGARCKRVLSGCVRRPGLMGFCSAESGLRGDPGCDGTYGAVSGYSIFASWGVR